MESAECLNIKVNKYNWKEQLKCIEGEIENIYNEFDTPVFYMCASVGKYADVAYVIIDGSSQPYLEKLKDAFDRDGKVSSITSGSGFTTLLKLQRMCDDDVFRNILDIGWYKRTNLVQVTCEGLPPVEHFDNDYFFDAPCARWIKEKFDWYKKRHLEGYFED
jgi:hypothetical protein